MKAVDLEEKSSLAKIISVNFSEQTLAKIYPNPSTADRVPIDISLEKAEKI